MPSIAILGAGVSGLTCAVVLAEAGHDVTIYAKEIEGTTSHAAAAIWFPYHVGGPEVESWASTTREVLVALSDDPRSGVSMIDFEILGETTLHVPLMDVTRYLPYLRERFGGRVVQREVRSLDELEGDVVVNCAGFGARALCGDDALVPGYGVSLLVDRPPLDRAIAHVDDPLMYIIPRRNDCLLGGYDAVTPPSSSDVAAIFDRCRAAVPRIGGEIRDVKHGIRPVRPQVRLEREGRVIHNYGHGGSGFTLSWGCAFGVLQRIA